MENTELVRQDLIQNIKRWTILDNNLKIINEKTKSIREERNQLSTQICKYLENTNLKNKKIGIYNGEIRMYEKKEYSPLTFTYIEECLGKIIPERDSVEFIMQYLKENREIKKNMDLRRIYNNENT